MIFHFLSEYNDVNIINIHRCSLNIPDGPMSKRKRFKFEMWFVIFTVHSPEKWPTHANKDNSNPAGSVLFNFLKLLRRSDNKLNESSRTVFRST